MQALCQWDAQRDECPEHLDELLGDLGAAPAAAKYARRLVHGYWSRKAAVDGRIESACDKWTLPRLSLVDRNAMRIAVVEMVEKIVPAKVAMTEAMEIGREFGGTDSARFINGVLDSVVRSLSANSGGGG